MLDYQILNIPKEKKPDSKMDVLLVAAPITLVDKYINVLEMAKLIPLALETEIIALSRALVGSSSDSPCSMIINIGASTTDIAIVQNGLLIFTRSIATGGIALTRAIATEINLDLTQAEGYKKSYGLDNTKLQGKIVAALKPIFDVIVNEIKRALSFYNSRWPTMPIKRIVLAGGTAKLPGIVIYLAENLGFEVQIGDPWSTIAKDERIIKILIEEGPMYSAAVGLALKELT
jgi:type IV pilus assembly protein PilM